MVDPIDLDGLSTTRLDPTARDAMMDAWVQAGNPGSAHVAGERAALLVERGRQAVAELVGASPAEIVLTSGATEADNLAVTGTALAALAGASMRRGIVVSAIEHKAVLEPAKRLRNLGFDVTIATVTREGAIDLDALRSIVGPHTLLVSVMAANNETGALQPIAATTAMAHAAGALFHTDATQIVGKLPVDLAEWGVDYASISSHKMHGPMGIGALYVAAHAPRPAALLVGGGQEQGLRAGTVPAPLAAGFGTAARVAGDALGDNAARAERLLAVVLKGIRTADVEYRINTGALPRLPGTVSLRIEGVDAEELAQTLSREILLSTGSACTAGQIAASHVLTAMQLTPEQASSTLRIRCDPQMSDEDARDAGTAIAGRVRRQLATGRSVQ